MTRKTKEVVFTTRLTRQEADACLFAAGYLKQKGLLKKGTKAEFLRLAATKLSEKIRILSQSKAAQNVYNGERRGK